MCHKRLGDVVRRGRCQGSGSRGALGEREREETWKNGGESKAHGDFGAPQI